MSGEGAFERPHDDGAHRLARARGLRAEPCVERSIDSTSELHGCGGARGPWEPRAWASGLGQDRRANGSWCLRPRLAGLELPEPSANADTAVRGERGAIVQDGAPPVAGLLRSFAEAPFSVGPRGARLRRRHPDALGLLLEDYARGPELAARVRGAEGLSRAGHGLEQTPQIQLQVRRQRPARVVRRPRVHPCEHEPPRLKRER